MEQIDIATTLKGVSEGNSKYFALLYNQFFAYSWRIATLTSNDSRETVEDIVQEVWSDVWKYRQSLATVKDFKSYIATAIRRRSMEVAVKERARTRWMSFQNLNEALPGPDIKIVRDEFSNFILNLVNYMPSKYKTLVYLQMAGYGKEHILFQLDISQQSFYNYNTVAKKFFQTVITAYHNNQRMNLKKVAAKIFNYGKN